MAKKEIEKRFLVTAVSEVFPHHYPSMLMEQGYVERAPRGVSFRVRTKNGIKAFLTAKSGRGISRNEDELSDDKVTIETADFLFKYLCEHRIEKRRHTIDGWEIDFCEPPLDGIVIAEREFKSMGEVPTNLQLPEWIGRGVDVTDSLTSHHLARLATLLKGSNKKAIDFVLKKLKLPIPKIVITGPPCSGKTKIINIIKKKMPEFHCVPEVASIVINQVGVKPGKDEFQNIMFQEKLYSIQDLFEATSIEFAIDENKEGCILDRGTVDNIGYFPGGLVRFVEHLKTTLEHEYDRYRGVVCLEVAPSEIYEIDKKNNPARPESETYEVACALQEKMIEAWQGHPRFYFIQNGPGGWNEKERKVLEIINKLLKGGA